MKPADAGLIASALTLTGRHALAVYDGEYHKWPDDYDKLTTAMVTQLEMVNSGIETTPKKTAKTVVEEEPVVVTVGLAPNIGAGEAILDTRNDLKTLLSDILKDGVEFAYAPSDIGWQWALDRANWSTISDQELSRRIKIKATFAEGAVGIEMGATGAKKRASRAKVAEPVEPVEAPEPAEVPELAEQSS
ncbi:MAG TPA: hypothetical protein VKT78_19635 [Fimbriimonadaceae bacterium]|nr:hypothetical protein [Fimbriimonadaceae bacterium]